MMLNLELGTPRVYMFAPVPAPRMTKAAAWDLRPGVLAYKTFCKEVRRRHVLIEYGAPVRLEFFLAMPPSWSDSEKQATDHMPHLSKPDCDNLVKGLFDAVFYKKQGGDSHCWAFLATARWALESHFIITPILGGL
jgi:Endodeoxyribonuclease RusA